MHSEIVPARPITDSCSHGGPQCDYSMGIPMKQTFLLFAIAASRTSAQGAGDGIGQIDNIVVIFAENRSFDVLYGEFPGADGLKKAKSSSYLQRDRNGAVLAQLPPIWKGLTAAGVTPPVTEGQTAHLR